MPKPPPLTNFQKNQLHQLEPQLRECVATADLKRAKLLAAKIQKLLKETGHNTRWMQNKNWLSECALEAGNIPFAIRHLKEVRSIMSDGTRIHIEATALLALCYIRTKRIDDALHHIKSVIFRVSKIESDYRRQQFHRRFINRIEEECILTGLVGEGEIKYDIDKIQEEAIALQYMDPQSLVSQLGSAIPDNSVKLLEGVRAQALKQLPLADRKCLPSPDEAKKPKELGKRAKAALKRVIWPAICDPNDEIYQAWSNGLSVVYDKKWLTTAICAHLTGWNISIPMIAFTVVALVFKLGVRVVCEMFAPDSMMISLADKR